MKHIRLSDEEFNVAVDKLRIAVPSQEAEFCFVLAPGEELLAVGRAPRQKASS
jgi:hypothetical protein